MLILPAAMSNIVGLAHIADQQAITQKIVRSHPFVRANHLINLPIPNHPLITHNQFVGSTIRDAAQDIHANIATFSYHAKVITPGPNVLETVADSLGESHLAPQQSLIFECDTVNDRQLQMFSRPMHNPAQHQIYNGPELDQISSNLHHQPIILDTAIANKCQAG